MPAPNNPTINDRIAYAKGWRRDEEPLKALWFGYLGRPQPKFTSLTRWRNPEGKPAVVPNWTGTLEGVSGMMRVLGHAWLWYFDEHTLKWHCNRRYYDERVGTGGQFCSDENKPGDCVGAAYLSIKEAG